MTFADKYNTEEEVEVLIEGRYEKGIKATWEKGITKEVSHGEIVIQLNSSGELVSKTLDEFDEVKYGYNEYAIGSW